jgi:hypothetical protein
VRSGLTDSSVPDAKRILGMRGKESGLLDAKYMDIKQHEEWRVVQASTNEHASMLNVRV